MKSLISINDLSKDDIIRLCNRAFYHTAAHTQTLINKIIMTMFFEPSTRTKFSFESAALRLGGNILNFSSDHSSLQKGESFNDTIRMANIYSDILIIRHPEEGAAFKACDISDIPVINAGDGKNEHPSQTLLDLFTIFRERQNLDNYTICLAGDLKHNRAIHSLIYALKLFNVSVILAAPPGLELPLDLEHLIAHRLILKTSSLEKAIQNADYLYMTRVQKERDENLPDYDNSWIITPELIKIHAFKDIKIMHPLPRVNEISTELDLSSHALYFEQAKNGVFMRMAILEYALGVW